METARSWTKAKLQEGWLPEPTKVRAKAGQVHPPHKNTKRNYGFRQRKVQASSANDNPGKKRNASKFCEFYGEVGHTTDEYMHLKRQIEEMFKAVKLSHLIKELKQSNRKDQAKATKRGNLKKGQAAGNTDGTTMAEGSQTKDYPNFLSKVSDLFSALRGDRTEGPMIIEAEMRGHFVHRMYVDGGSSL
ncbi:hypothetical protein Tco_0344072 [Tanacetum coccineum]